MSVFTASAVTQDRSNWPVMFQCCKCVKLSKLSWILADLCYVVPRVPFWWFRPPQNVGKPKCDEPNSPVHCGKRCTINPANGDRLSVRKIVKNKVNIERRILHSNSVKRWTCKNTSSELCCCRALSHLGTAGTKGWFSQATVVGSHKRRYFQYLFFWPLC